MLPHAYGVFRLQNIEQIEWIVVDDSENKSAFMLKLTDPRVRYIHLPERASTGEKRNIAVDAARSDIIVQFDDDDYYSPNYIRTMINCLSTDGADFAKLCSFFLYSKIHKQYGYWDLQDVAGIHFVWSSDPTAQLFRLPQTEEVRDMYLGYGFSYVFKKKVWESAHFPHIFWNQDTPFIKAAIESGFKISLVKDHAGLCLHILHGGNASKSFPQYIIPSWMIERLFPNIDAAYLS